MLRKLIAVDNNYAYHVTQGAGNGGHFDVSKFQDAVRGEGVDVLDTLITVTQYVPRDGSVEAYAEVRNHVERISHALEMNGCRVIVCPAKKSANGAFKQSDDFRLMIATLSACLRLRPDMLVFVGGDGDFAPLIWELRNEGIRTEVVADSTSLASDLARAAYNVVDLVDVLNSFDEREEAIA